MVEVRQVQTRAEHALARVARMADDRAADDADLDAGIEEREVDRRLGRRQRDAVLGIEVPVVPDLEVRDVPPPLEIRAAQVGDTRRTEVVESFDRRCRGTEHRPDEVRAAARRREDEGQEEALRDLDALFLGERTLALGCDLLLRRDEPRELLGGRVHELVVAQRGRQTVRQRRVDGLGVHAQEGDSRRVRVAFRAVDVGLERRPVLHEGSGQLKHRRG